MRGDLCRKQVCTVTVIHYCTTTIIVDRALQQSSIDTQLFVQNRDLCLFYPHSTLPLRGPRRNIAMMFGVEKLEWLATR